MIRNKPYRLHIDANIKTRTNSSNLCCFNTFPDLKIMISILYYFTTLSLPISNYNLQCQYLVQCSFMFIVIIYSKHFVDLSLSFIVIF